MKLSRRRLRKGLPPISFRRPCVMVSGVRMDEALEKLGAQFQKYPMDDTSPSPYTLVLLD